MPVKQEPIDVCWSHGPGLRVLTGYESNPSVKSARTLGKNNRERRATGSNFHSFDFGIFILDYLLAGIPLLRQVD